MIMWFEFTRVHIDASQMWI